MQISHVVLLVLLRVGIIFEIHRITLSARVSGNTDLFAGIEET